MNKKNNRLASIVFMSGLLVVLFGSCQPEAQETPNPRESRVTSLTFVTANRDFPDTLRMSRSFVYDGEGRLSKTLSNVEGEAFNVNYSYNATDTLPVRIDYVSPAFGTLKRYFRYNDQGIVIYDSASSVVAGDEYITVLRFNLVGQRLLVKSENWYNGDYSVYETVYRLVSENGSPLFWYTQVDLEEVQLQSVSYEGGVFPAGVRNMSPKYYIIDAITPDYFDYTAHPRVSKIGWNSDPNYWEHLFAYKYDSEGRISGWERTSVADEEYSLVELTYE